MVVVLGNTCPDKTGENGRLLRQFFGQQATL